MTLPARTHQLRIAGLALTGLSALSAEGAWLHMRALGVGYGVICGASAPHCMLCPLSLALLVSGLAAFSAGSAPRPHAARVTRHLGVRR